MGQHALPVAEQFGPVPADRPAHKPVFFVNRPSFAEQGGLDFGDGSAAKRLGLVLHPLKSRKQVDRRGPAGGQNASGFVQPLKKGRFIGIGGRLHADAHPVGGGDADGLAAPAHAERSDRLGDSFEIAAVDFDELAGQAGLVDQPQAAIDAAEPVESGEGFHVSKSNGQILLGKRTIPLAPVV